MKERFLVQSLNQIGLTSLQILAELRAKRHSKQLIGRDEGVKGQEVRNMKEHLEQQTWRHGADAAISSRHGCLIILIGYVLIKSKSCAPIFDSTVRTQSDAAQPSTVGSATISLAMYMCCYVAWALKFCTAGYPHVKYASAHIETHGTAVGVFYSHSS